MSDSECMRWMMIIQAGLIAHPRIGPHIAMQIMELAEDAYYHIPHPPKMALAEYAEQLIDWKAFKNALPTWLKDDEVPGAEGEEQQ